MCIFFRINITRNNFMNILKAQIFIVNLFRNIILPDKIEYINVRLCRYIYMPYYFTYYLYVHVSLRFFFSKEIFIVKKRKKVKKIGNKQKSRVRPRTCKGITHLATYSWCCEKCLFSATFSERVKFTSHSVFSVCNHKELNFPANLRFFYMPFVPNIHD